MNTSDLNVGSFVRRTSLNGTTYMWWIPIMSYRTSKGHDLTMIGFDKDCWWINPRFIHVPEYLSPNNFVSLA